jgi:hypothetical protein
MWHVLPLWIGACLNSSHRSSQLACGFYLARLLWLEYSIYSKSLTSCTTPSISSHSHSDYSFEASSSPFPRHSPRHSPLSPERQLGYSLSSVYATLASAKTHWCRLAFFLHRSSRPPTLCWSRRPDGFFGGIFFNVDLCVLIWSRRFLADPIVLWLRSNITIQYYYQSFLTVAVVFQSSSSNCGNFVVVAIFA